MYNFRDKYFDFPLGKGLRYTFIENRVDDLSPVARRTASTNKRLGKCYQLSWQFVVSNPNWYLVHGYLTDFDHGRVIDHAWCEKENKVFDPVLDKTYSKDLYYALYQVEMVSDFSSEKAMERGAETGVYGPWHEPVKTNWWKVEKEHEK